MSTGYGLRFSAEIYGSKRENIVFREYLQEYCSVLTEISEIIRKPSSSVSSAAPLRKARELATYLGATQRDPTHTN